MGVCYDLVNNTKRERIAFACLPAHKMHELAGNSTTSAIVTWYLLHNAGDSIAFVSDTNGEWPFTSGTRDDLLDFPDVTNRVVDDLIANKILADHGIGWADELEPETIHYRDIRNVWPVV
jgi:hypothetical protein